MQKANKRNRPCRSPRNSAKAFTDSHIDLDDSTILWRNADVEQERRVAIFDLIEENTFKPVRSAEKGATGPYTLGLSVRDDRLALDISDAQGQELETIMLGLARFKRPIRDYFAICDSYYQAIRKVETDFATARRLFTLICVLHIRG